MNLCRRPPNLQKNLADGAIAYRMLTVVFSARSYTFLAVESTLPFCHV